MTTQLFTDNRNESVIAWWEHVEYREDHDSLHLAYRSACGEPCPIRDHAVLQGEIVAVRAVERRAR